MTILSCENICYEVGTNIILDNISFSINEGDILGITGINGTGKSTLVKIISSQLKQTSGAVYISKNKTLGIFNQNETIESSKNIYDEIVASFSELKTIENKLEQLEQKLSKSVASEFEISEYERLNDRYIKLGGLEYKGRIKSTLIKFGFNENTFNQSIVSLSGGEKTRLALVKLLMLSPDILILDEPTNQLDLDTLIWLEDYLSTYKKTIILISHDRYFLDKLTNKTLELENKKAHLYNGNYSSFVTQKKEFIKSYEKQYAIQEKEIKRIEEMIEQQRRWGQERNFVTIKSKEKQLERTKKLEALEKAPKNIAFKFEKGSNSGNDVLLIDSLCKSFENKLVLNNVNLTIHRGDRLFIIGPNGCGKSTLLKILCEKLYQDSGEYYWGYNIEYGYYSQEQNTLSDETTLFDEISNSYPNLTNTEIRNALAKFQFRHDDVFKLCKNLSGGERVRLVLCKMILSKHNVLVLDEPTNHLDIQSKEVLEDALLDFDGTIICVSHDRYLINKLSNRIFDMKQNPYLYYPRPFSEYNEYLDKLQKNIVKVESESKIKKASENKLNREQTKKHLSDIRKTKTKLLNIEKEISECEQRKEECNSEMLTYIQDYKKLNELAKEISMIEERIEELYFQFDETETILKELESENDE